MIRIVRARVEQSEELSKIAIAAKRHWNYPESWIKAWMPALTITPEFITSAEVWAAEVNGEAAGFHALIIEKERTILEHLWVLPSHIGRGVGRALFEHALARCREKGIR